MKLQVAMNLYEKIQTTIPGRHAVALGELRYNNGQKLGETWCTQLAAAEAYLETLAIAELERDVEPWIKELVVKREKDCKVADPRPFKAGE